MLSIVIFLSILFLQISSEDSFDCTGYEDDSFHPMYNSNDCRYYWHCIYVDTVYMRAVKRSCPAGTEFDILLNECEISSLVNCVPIEPPSRTSRSTKLFSQKQTTTKPQQIKVLPNNSSQLTPVFFIEQLLKNLIDIKKKQISNIIELESTSPPPFLTSKLKRRHIIHRHNLTLHILTSNEHKIRQFSINQTHGLLIQCNEIRRRHLRDLIFRPTPSPTTVTMNSSSKILHYEILSLTIFYKFFLIFTKISD